ncbi:MAG: hypothetical protein JXR54_05640 [Tannerellaceae bacterium]|nr:hypothetical protein [Tannerellaceae bacterium]
MKLIYFAPLLILCWLTCNSQTNNINNLDSSGLKQGNWIEYDSLAISGIIYSIQLQPDSINHMKNDQINVASEYELIKHVGLYINGNKDGVWEIFKSNNTLWMKVNYRNGIRTRFEIFFPNGKHLYTAKDFDKENFLIKEYSKEGKLIKEKYFKKELINSIEDTKLFIVGY